MGALALMEVIERDGSVRQSLKVETWPLRVGRAIDNHLVLDDPHVAAHHLSIDTNEDGIFITVGDSLNGVNVGTQRLAAGERWQAGAEPLHLTAGRTALRLRLASHVLPPEQPLRAARELAHGLGSLLLLLGLMLAAQAFETYLGTDNESYWPALGTACLGTAAVLLGWSGVWTMLSKIFARRGHFGWHLRVALLGALALHLTELLTQSAAFAFSWPWASSFGFVPNLVVVSAAVYLHLQAVEPHRHVLTRSLALGCALGGIALSLWMHWQRTDQLGSELYMNHLMPPALRVAPPVPLDTFFDRAQTLQATLDEKARREEAEAE